VRSSPRTSPKPRPSPRPSCSREALIRLYILAIGRLRRGPFADLQTFYAGRIVPRATIVEFEEKRRLPPPQLKAREAELLLAAVPAGARIVALDETGAQWSSRELADRLSAWRDGGTAALAFTIGGADGLGAAVIEHADTILSFGTMTWPHFLVRGMLLEQLYRAQQISAGHPYHRE
jgi:23S rRNA (pseudouridine1915-N3)-methyltransferase